MSKLLKMNLQTFAEPSADPGTDPVQADPKPGSDPTPGAAGGTDLASTFTQEDVDKIVAGRLARERKDMPTKEELDAYNTWKESQQTEQEKTNAELERLRKENENYKKKTSDFENKQKAIEKNVPVNFADFVVFKVQETVTDELDFDAALDKYLKENPQYASEEPTTPTTGRPQRTPAGQPMDDVAAAFVKRTGLKPKNE